MTHIPRLAPRPPQGLGTVPRPPRLEDCISPTLTKLRAEATIFARTPGVRIFTPQPRQLTAVRRYSLLGSEHGQPGALAQGQGRSGSRGRGRARRAGRYLLVRQGAPTDAAEALEVGGAPEWEDPGPGSARGEGLGGGLGGLPLGELGLLSSLLDLVASDPDRPPTGSTARAAVLR